MVLISYLLKHFNYLKYIFYHIIVLIFPSQIITCTHFEIISTIQHIFTVICMIFLLELLKDFYLENFNKLRLLA